MAARRALNKDHLGGGLLVAAGVAVAVAAAGYGMGSLRQMGSGFFPLVLGVLLAAAGLALLATARRGDGSVAAEVEVEVEAPTTHLAGPVVQWRGWACIVGGVLAFVVLGQHGGLVPASFASVFVAALGDRANGVRDAAALAAVLTLFGVLVFHFGLHLLLPLFTWG